MPRGDTFKECSRCHNGIAVFSNRIAYGGTMTTLDRESGESKQESLQVWSDVSLCESCQRELHEFLQGS